MPVRARPCIGDTFTQGSVGTAKQASCLVMVPRDLHIHTTWSAFDASVVPEQRFGSDRCRPPCAHRRHLERVPPECLIELNNRYIRRP